MASGAFTAPTVPSWKREGSSAERCAPNDSSGVKEGAFKLQRADTIKPATGAGLHVFLLYLMRLYQIRTNRLEILIL
jgi:hypothetical protein